MSSKIQHCLESLDKWLSRVGLLFIFIGAVCLCIITVLVVFELIGRQLGFAGKFGNEISGYMYVALTFLPSGYVFREGLFINITLLTDRLSLSYKRILRLVTDIIVLVIVILTMKGCWDMFLYSYNHKIVSNSILEVPMYLPQIAPVIGISVLVIVAAVGIVSSILFQSSRRK